MIDNNRLLPLGLQKGSHFERTGRLGPKIDVFFVVGTAPLALTYKHSTNWRRTCREAREAAARHYHLPVKSLRAYFAKRA